MRVLIVDDEPLARRRLVRMLDRIEDTTVLGEAENGEEALAMIRALHPDVVLLDVRMPKLDGLTLASEPRLPPIIFTTAYDEYAVRAFEASAADYLMKPIEEERLRKALRKVRNATGANPEELTVLLRQALAGASGAEVPRITARAGRTIRVFDAREISRFHASDRYTLFRHGDQEFVLDESLNTLEKRLDAHGFVRVHRSELVNVDHIHSLHLEDGATSVVLRDEQMAPVSRRLVPELKRRLGMLDA